MISAFLPAQTAAFWSGNNLLFKMCSQINSEITQAVLKRECETTVWLKQFECYSQEEVDRIGDLLSEAGYRTVLGVEEKNCGGEFITISWGHKWSH